MRYGRASHIGGGSIPAYSDPPPLLHRAAMLIGFLLVSFWMLLQWAVPEVELLALHSAEREQQMIDGFLSIGVFLVLFGVAFELIIGITEQLRGERNQAGRLADLSGRTRFDRPSRRYKRIQVSREELQEIKARLASEAKLL